jgi:hypothetical protein
MRAAASDWIVISVRAKPPQVTTISADEIHGFLRKHGRSEQIAALRLSCHSRGSFDLVASLASKKLVASNPVGGALPSSVVDRIISFDSDSGHLMPAVRTAGVNPDTVFGFQTTVIPPSWTIPVPQSIQLVSGPPIPPRGTMSAADFAQMTKELTELYKKAVRAVGYARLVIDAPKTHPGLSIPPNIVAMANSLALPPLGTFTSRSTGGGLLNFQEYCLSRKSTIEQLLGAEARSQQVSDLYLFITANDLARVANTSVLPGIWQHHLFVAEFAHEVTDVLPPRPG